MIATILGFLGLALPAGGTIAAIGTVLGFAIKALKWAGIGGSLVANPVSALLEKFAGLVEWIIKGVLGYIGTWLKGGLDVVSKDTRVATVVLLAAWGGYFVAGIGRPDPVSPPAAKSESSRATPKTAAPKKPQTTAPFDPFDWISNAFR